VFLSASVYLIVILGIGLFISTLTNNQQQAMFIAFFFMIAFLLMSGLFTAIENMPHWAQVFNKINPIAYFIRIIRMILLKGSGLFDILHDLLSLLVSGIVVLSLSVWRYKKTS
jgi:ABC-2 type transport system permease protein